MNIASERQEVQRLARKYREEGYAVFTREDAAKILPETLHGVVPDLVVSKGHEHILVKVKMKGESEDREHIIELAEAIQQEPHWRLQVHLFEPDRRSCTIVVEAEILEQNRRSAVQLFESGQVLPALLFMWSVFEAAGARALHTEGVDVYPTWEHGSLVTELAFRGLIEDDEYERLRETQALRNLVAHGALAMDVQKNDFKQLDDITERLIVHNRSVE